MDNSKKDQGGLPKASAVNANVEDEQRAVASAQNVQGAASTSTRSAAAVAIAMSSSTRSAQSTNTNTQAQVYSGFMNQVEQCLAEYREVGNWLSDQIYGYMEDVEISGMLKTFLDLPPLVKALIIVLLLGIVGLLGWMAWEGVAFAWPHILKFLSSTEGQAFLDSASAMLKSLGESPIMKNIVSIWTTAAETEQSTDAALPAPPCFGPTDWLALTSLTAGSVLDISKIFFQYFAKVMTGKEK